MKVINNIVYADNEEFLITVVSVRAMEDYKLWARFSTGETKVFDFVPFLDKGMFSLLKDKTLFNDVYVDYGIPVWCNGDIDIAPERLYYEGVSVNN